MTLDGQAEVVTTNGEGDILDLVNGKEYTVDKSEAAEFDATVTEISKSAGQDVSVLELEGAITNLASSTDATTDATAITGITTTETVDIEITFADGSTKTV